MEIKNKDSGAAADTGGQPDMGEMIQPNEDTSTEPGKDLGKDDDPQDCTLTIGPGASFDEAFGQLSAGQTLCLKDGKYVQAMDLPSRIHVRAIHDGMAEIDGEGRLGGQGGLLQMEGEGSSARGLRVHHAAPNADACRISGSNHGMRFMSCSHGGSHKHKIPLKISGSGHTIENSWFFGEGRYVVQCFRGNDITIRQNLMRWDNTTPNEPNEPNAAMSNYSCVNMIWENNISIDYGKPETRMRHCGDMCMSTTQDTPNQNVQYLGNIVVNHDPDTDNNVAFRADQKSMGASNTISVKDFYVKKVKRAMGFNPKYENLLIENCTMIDVPEASRIGGRPLPCEGMADITFEYKDGVKTQKELFPWPQEELIKSHLCAAQERQSDWCLTDTSLTEYILE